jgi:membrane protein YqaA with SNARE-associated domain
VPSPEGEPLDWRRLAVFTVLGLGAVLAAVVVVGAAFEPELLAASRWFVERFGLSGIAIGFLVPDATSLPFPQDALLALGLVGGLGFWEVVAWGTAGSVAGGTVGFFFGRRLQRTALYARLSRRKGFDAESIVRRYGVMALALGALTPLPYSVCTWTCGALGMRLAPFLVVSLLRVVRVGGYLWLIQLGLFRVIG